MATLKSNSFKFLYDVQFREFRHGNFVLKIPDLKCSEAKRAVSDFLNVPIENIRLIWEGKIIKDNERIIWAQKSKGNFIICLINSHQIQLSPNRSQEKIKTSKEKDIEVDSNELLKLEEMGIEKEQAINALMEAGTAERAINILFG